MSSLQELNHATVNGENRSTKAVKRRVEVVDNPSSEAKVGIHVDPVHREQSDQNQLQHCYTLANGKLTMS